MKVTGGWKDEPLFEDCWFESKCGVSTSRLADVNWVCMMWRTDRDRGAEFACPHIGAVIFFRWRAGRKCSAPATAQKAEVQSWEGPSMFFFHHGLHQLVKVTDHIDRCFLLQVGAGFGKGLQDPGINVQHCHVSAVLKGLKFLDICIPPRYVAQGCSNIPPFYLGHVVHKIDPSHRRIVKLICLVEWQWIAWLILSNGIIICWTRFGRCTAKGHWINSLKICKMLRGFLNTAPWTNAVHVTYQVFLRAYCWVWLFKH